MNRIEVACANGHKLKAKEKLAGRTLKCPKCQAEVRVPGPRPDRPASALSVSDLDVMNFLGDQEPLPPPPKLSIHDELADRYCPRCGATLGAKATVCKACNCYVAISSDFMDALGPSESK